MVKRVAVLVNPYSGRDVRRISSNAKTVTNWERIRVLREFLLGLNTASVDEVLFFPDSDGISEYMIEEYEGKLSYSLVQADMRLEYNWRDSTIFAKIAYKENASSMLVLGGDGTVRAVAKAMVNLPLLPLSMGTNNVMAYNISPTHAGIILGFHADKGLAPGAIYYSKRILVEYDNGMDMGLVDIAFTDYEFIGARAVLDTSRLREVYVALGRCRDTGLTSIVGFIKPIDRRDPVIARIVLGNGKKSLAVLAPGLVRNVQVKNIKEYAIPYTEEKMVDYSVVSFDGERDLILKNQSIRITADNKGPPIIDPQIALMEIAKRNRIELGIGDEAATT